VLVFQLLAFLLQVFLLQVSPVPVPVLVFLLVVPYPLFSAVKRQCCYYY